MILVQHRVNTLEALGGVPPAQGVEVDLHAYADGLVVHHEPKVEALAYSTWLQRYRHALAILNVKEEGIEREVIESAESQGLRDFFLLDVSLPALVRLARGGERRLAVRISEYEPVAGALALAPLLDWAWVDSFERYPLTASDHRALKAEGLRLCAVSPELHGRDPSEIKELRERLARDSMPVDAVCTKYPDLWAAPGETAL